MYEFWIADLPSSVDLRQGISEEQIDRVEKERGIKFPEQYRELLLFSNGLDGTVGRVYVQIYALHAALETNDKFKEFTEGLFIFGSDGGGEAYVFDPINEWRILMVTFVSMGRADAVQVADNLKDFIRKLSFGKTFL